MIEWPGGLQHKCYIPRVTELGVLFSAYVSGCSGHPSPPWIAPNSIKLLLGCGTPCSAGPRHRGGARQGGALARGGNPPRRSLTKSTSPWDPFEEDSLGCQILNVSRSSAE